MTEGPPSEGPGRSPGTIQRKVAYLDQALWRQLAEGGSDREFCYAWLSLQARQISGALSGLVVMGLEETGPFSPVAAWPRAQDKPGNLSGVLEKTLAERKGVVRKGDAGEGSDPVPEDSIHLAYPVRAAGKLRGAVAFEISSCPPEKLPVLMRRIQWGTAWLEKWLLGKEVDSDSVVRKRLTWALDLSAVAVEEARFKAAATSFATELATRLDCDRVSIGFKSGNHIKVKALSHSSHFKKQMNLIGSIEAAMEESADQRATLVYPAPAGEVARVLRAHGELAVQEGDGAICTIPFLSSEGDHFGAITLERTSDKPFDEETRPLIEGVISLVAPILNEKRSNDSPFPVRIARSGGKLVRAVTGKGHVAAKLITAGVLGGLLFMGLVTGESRVTARSTIEGAVQRAVTAPFDGYIIEASVRAGDTVKEGQVICRIDDRDISLQRQRVLSSKEQYLRQYREAMAAGDRSNMKILGEQVNQAEAQLALLEDQLSRTKLLAPLTGVVVSGDLSQSLGTPVQRGQVLFEVAPLHDYRVKLQVDERRISEIKVGQKGQMVLNSLPHLHIPVTVKKITPVSTPFEGRNFFLVEAGLDETSDRIRPGMEGYGKVRIGRRSLIRIWTDEIITWVRLKMWSWLP